MDSLTMISQFSVLIPLLIGLYYYKGLPRPFQWLVVYVAAAALTEGVNSVLKFTLGSNTYSAYAFFSAEPMLLYLVFYPYLSTYRSFRIIINVLILFLPAIVVSDYFFHGLQLFPSYTRGFGGFVISLMTLFALYHYFRSDDMKHTEQRALLWLCLGSLVYFATNTNLFNLMNSLVMNVSSSSLISKDIHSLSNILYYLFYTVSFRCFSNPTATTHFSHT